MLLLYQTRPGKGAWERMKSYIAQDRIHAQGKAWQIRILLSQWMKEAGGSVPLSEFIHTRTRPSASAAHGRSKAGR